MQKAPIMPTSCNLLRAAEIEINSVAVRFHGFRAEEQLIGVVSAELFQEDQTISAIGCIELYLDNERSVCFETSLLPILGVEAVLAEIWSLTR